MNHFGGSLGGPILRNKLFFFFDSEWVRIALPIVSHDYRADPAFQDYVLTAVAVGRDGYSNGLSLSSRRPQSVPFYQKMFSLYRDTAGRRCPFSAVRSTATGVIGWLPAEWEWLRESPERFAFERRSRAGPDGRIDYNINEKNMTWYRFQADSGLQAAYTDPINPLFNAISPQPLYSFASGYTHVFSSSLVNYFNPAFSWYESLFGPSDFQKTLVGVSDRAPGQRRECTVYDAGRPGQYLGAGTAGHPLLHQ